MAAQARPYSPRSRSNSSSSSSLTDTHSTPLSSVPDSPVSCLKDAVVLPIPFLPPTLENTDRQCPPLPPPLPPVPWNDTPNQVDTKDEKTPDSWIKRHPNLLRLTGKHPFNSEARLAPLFDAGFLTPAHLHVVRNHGAVPRVDAAKARDWRIRVHGLVEHETSFSIEDLKDRFSVVTVPVTVCCAGNRRREQNVFRKTLGFSWGSAGVSTALWTGVYLADVLKYVEPFRRSAKYVIFEGADELPQGPYGTSQLLSKARNRDNAMLIAWAMNGLPLEPDHGYPIRVIIPGQIGGRMVKWLTRIEVSAQESQHHLHFRDNKVLPTELTPERARVEDHWWYDPRYMITELNVNSVIAKPDHDETVLVPHSTSENGSTYKVRGYAYAGGGRRIGRVEVSLDDGDYPEDLFRHVVHDDPVYGTIDLTEKDTSFCWCFWTLPISLTKLSQSKVITVRAMDEAMNVQPRDMYPNPTGMLNNWWFRVAVHASEAEGGLQLRFEHPAPVSSAGGWMERMRAEGKDPVHPSFDTAQTDVPVSHPASEVCMTKPGVTRKITPEEVKTHDPRKPWFVVNGEVYDATGYLKDHPGGADSILLLAGDDASEDFMNIHSVDAKLKLAEYHIGTLTAPLSSLPPASPSSQPTPTSFLNPKTWKPVTLTSVHRLNHDSALFRFAFSDADADGRLGLPVGQHVFVRLRRKRTGEVVQRAYTPVSRADTKGGVEFLVKLYLPCTAYPLGGKMTSGFDELEVGDEVEVKGPLGSFAWLGQGTAMWRGVERKVTEIGMVCGGSGITPILQVLRAVLEDREDTRTTVNLLYANKTEADILCRAELDALSQRFPSRFSVHYVLGTVREGWAYSQGRVTEALLRMFLPEPGDEAMVLACGPEGMITQAVRPGLEGIGWDIEKSLVVF
ncbi:hypothetical protein BXZ70DRAFT_1001920 [Cristinia sonorae]|uniref:Nitrate reductase [NADPH] n=1 Tax=Cristinia sonorae TaxID=1940300 RepID=A0A8K0UJJ3_9AGAR|nr:hypothetical protein BXZ70DRAFT_1001920 [Cristinia sonorae]